jgi:biopolymer transport protein ExbB
MVGAGLLVVAQAANPSLAPAASDSASIKIESVWDFVKKGGPTMAAIGLCSLVALTVIVERSIVVRRRAVIPPRFVSALQNIASDTSKAAQLCESDPSPVASVLGAVIRNRGRPAETVEKAVRAAGSRVLIRLRHRMRPLSALPQVATMLGLLGTIFGMIKTFQAVALSGQSLGKTETLARGIFEAWTNTAAGLLVAIPVLIAYHVLMGRIDAAAAELDRVAAEWMEADVRPALTAQSASLRAVMPEPAVVPPTLVSPGIAIAAGA